MVQNQNFGDEIKGAVYGNSSHEEEYSPPIQNNEEMQPSIINSQQQEAPEQELTAPYQNENKEEYVPQEQPYYPQEQNYYTPNYNQYAGQEMSNVDAITEIADQIFEEKASLIRDQLEKTLSFKNSVESKIDYIDERLKRIERILDRLQLSILQKVGDQLTNIEDIKKEMIETQKSFKSILEKNHHK